MEKQLAFFIALLGCMSADKSKEQERRIGDVQEYLLDEIKKQERRIEDAQKSLLDEVKEQEIKIEDVKECLLGELKELKSRIEDSQGPSSGCEKGWKPLLGHCYYFSNVRRTWHDSKNICENWSSNLVKIESQEEDEAIVSYIREIGLKSRDYWIGLNDIAKEDSFVWVSDNASVGFNNWNYHEPNNRDGYQNCVQLYNGYGWEWDDVECDDTNSFICKKDQNKC